MQGIGHGPQRCQLMEKCGSNHLILSILAVAIVPLNRVCYHQNNKGVDGCGMSADTWKHGCFEYLRQQNNEKQVILTSASVWVEMKAQKRQGVNSGVWETSSSSNGASGGRRSISRQSASSFGSKLSRLCRSAVSSWTSWTQERQLH